MKQLLNKLTAILVVGCTLGFTSCASTSVGGTSPGAGQSLSSFLQSEIAKAKTWAASDGGKATLNAVALAADAFDPAYAGVLGLGINSLEAPAGSAQSIPTASQIAGTLASVTGNASTDNKIATLASAVLTAAANAPTPNGGLAQAAATVNTTAQANVSTGSVHGAPTLITFYDCDIDGAGRVSKRLVSQRFVQ